MRNANGHDFALRKVSDVDPDIRVFPFINPKYNCFSNSVIQLLLSIPTFRDLLRRLVDVRLDSELMPLLCSLVSLCADLDSQTSAMNTQVVPDTLGTLMGRDQQDAAEYLSTLLNALDEEIKIGVPFMRKRVTKAKHAKKNTKKKEPSGWTQVGVDTRETVHVPSVISDLCGIQLMQHIEKKGSTNLQDLQYWYLLDIDIPNEKSCSLTTALTVYFSGTKLDKHRTARLEVQRLPPCLLIHIKKFTCQRQKTVKLEARIDICEELDMKKYTRGKGSAKYRLHAVVEHYGESALRGHYDCAVRSLSDGVFCVANDDKISRNVGFDTVSQKDPYILLYLKD